jgi:acetylornithine deacetylase/succinyl-diaminopimelate desuccinylase-like protein
VKAKEKSDKRVVTLLRELIRNRCVNNGEPDSGGEIKSARTLKRFFESCNIKPEILESKKGRANLLVRIPGTESDAPSLMYMCHLDVVPAEEDDWSCHPFSGDEHGGYIWGRGAVDMLNIAACQAVAFADVVREKKQLPGDFVFCAVSDEEASGRLGARWLVEKHWKKVKADYMITEAGGFFIKGKKGDGIVITIGEKGIAWTRLLAKGVSGHGSLPFMAKNAGVRVAQASALLVDHPMRIHIYDEYRDMIRSMKLGKVQETLLLNPYTLNGTLTELYKTSPGLARHLHAISRMTVSPNVIRSGIKINVIPDKGVVELDIRILPGQTVEDVMKEIRRILGPEIDNFEIEVLDYFPSNVSQKDTPLFDATFEIARTIYPGITPIPAMFSGVTDARFWRMKGTVVYGFALFDESMTMDEYIGVLHGKDERISLKNLELSYHYFLRLPEVFYRKVAEREQEEE